MMKEGKVSSAQKDLSFVICIGNTAFFAQKRPELAKIPYMYSTPQLKALDQCDQRWSKGAILDSPFDAPAQKLFRVQHNTDGHNLGLCE